MVVIGNHSLVIIIVASKPTRSKPSNEFDISEDGRLLIDGDG